MAAHGFKRVKEFLASTPPGKGWKVFVAIVKCLLAVSLLACLIGVALKLMSPQLHWFVYFWQGSPEPPENYTGRWRRWDDRGRLYQEEHYVSGKRDGQFTTWDDKGRVMATIGFHEGKRHGPRLEYYTNGSLQLKSEYMHDMPVGSRTEYNRDGTTNALRVYSRPGAPDGPELRWKRTGEQEVLRVWRDGAPWDGKFYSMSNSDQILRVYTNGVLVSERNLGRPRGPFVPVRPTQAAKPASP